MFGCVFQQCKSKYCILCRSVERAKVAARSGHGLLEGSPVVGDAQGPHRWISSCQFPPVLAVLEEPSRESKILIYLLHSPSKSQELLYFTLPWAFPCCKDIQVYLLLLDFGLPTRTQVLPAHGIREELDNDWSYLGSPDFEQCLSETRLKAVQPVFLLL